MVPADIKRIIEEIHYHLDTVDVLLEFNRTKESLLFVPLIIERMIVLEKSANSEKMPSIECFLKKSLHSNLSCQQVVDKIKQCGSDYMKVKDEEIKSLGYDHFIKQLNDLYQMQVKWLKKAFQTPAEKKFKQSCWAVVIVTVLFVAGNYFYHVIQLRGTGLRGEYYKGANFKEKIGTGLNHTINCYNYLEIWKNLPSDFFSVRWTGYLIVPKDGKYVFSFDRDNGLRYYLDDKLLIDEWREDVGSPSTPEIDLKRGFHKIKIEFFDTFGSECIRFYWNNGKNPREIVAAKYLRPDKGK